MTNSNWVEQTKHRIAYHLGVDRRTSFYDLASLKPVDRTIRSDVIQFYSGVPNIGNYLPVLGIRKVLGQTTDLWDAHDEGIDWTLVNENYEWAIIGGAGLLHSDFESFWERFATHCDIPFVVWGVGACFPDSEDDPGVSPSVARPILDEAPLVNLRDDLTARRYNLDSAHISPCPTVAYLESRDASRFGSPERLLYSSHTELVGEQEQDAIYAALEESSFDFKYTDNIERRLEGLEDIVGRYAQSSLVVTTRLHGAIIAYALQVPYIALARDDKVRAFHRLYGNGKRVEGVERVRELLEDPPDMETGPVERDSVYEFGQRVMEWRRNVASQSAVRDIRS